jgi:hypothetical protein
LARKLRVEYEGAIYQVMNRGDRREPIFLDEEDRQRFMTTLGEACTKTGWQVHALFVNDQLSKFTFVAAVFRTSIQSA